MNYACHPDVLRALCYPVSLGSREPPASIEVVVPEGCGDLEFINIAKLALVASGGNREYARMMHTILSNYLNGKCGTRDLMEAAKKVLDVTIRIVAPNASPGSKRGGINRALELERRLDAYDSDEDHPVATIEAVCAALADLGYPGLEASRFPLNAYGYREGTCGQMLIRAISTLPETGMRSSCSAYFERLATQIWGWKYPKLSGAQKRAIMEDFHKVQSSLAAGSCPNVVIRMLWHFGRIGIKTNPIMFKVPLGEDTLAKNLAALASINS